MFVLIRKPNETLPPPNPTPNSISSSRFAVTRAGNSGLCPQSSTEPQGTCTHAATSGTISSSSWRHIPPPITATASTEAPGGSPPRQTLLVIDIMSSRSELARQDCPIEEAHPSPPAALHTQEPAQQEPGIALDNIRNCPGPPTREPIHPEIYVLKQLP